MRNRRALPGACGRRSTERALNRVADAGASRARGVRGGEAGAGSPCGPRRGRRGSRARGWCGWCRARPRSDPAVLIGGDVQVRGLLDRPAHDQEKPNDRDLQQEHQPDERPGGHAPRSYTRPLHPYKPPMWRWTRTAMGSQPDQPRSCSGAPLNCVIACSSPMRATISLPVRRSIRSVPNSSTLKEASTVAWAIARRSS